MDEERWEQELQHFLKTEVEKAEPSSEWWDWVISRLGEKKQVSQPGKAGFWKLRPSLVTVPLSIFLIIILVGGFLIGMGGMAPPPPPAPVMVSDGYGGAFIIWLDNPWNSDATIRAQYVDAQGKLMWGEDGRQLAAGYAGQPYAVGDINGGIIVAWKDGSGSHLIKLSPAGDTIWVVESFSSCSVMGMVKDGSGGAILLLYDPDDGISAQRLSAEGRFLWGVNGTFLGYTQDIHRGESLVSDGLGGAVIIWQEQGEHYYMEFRAQHLSTEGAPLWGDDGIIITSMEQAQGSNRDIIADGTGNFFVTWDTESGMSGAPDVDVYVQKIDEKGNPMWGEDGILVCENQVTESYNPADMQSHPQVVADGVGGALVTWHDRRRIMNREVFAQRINAAGEILWTENGVWVWDIPAKYFMTASGTLDATVIPDGAGGAIVVWTGYTVSYASNSVIYAQRLSLDGQRLWPDEKVYTDLPFQSQGYASIVGDGQGGVIIGSRVGESSSVSKTDSTYVQKIDARGSHIWGKSGLAIHKVHSALTVQFIALGAILATVFILVSMFRRNRIAQVFTAIMPVFLGIAGLFGVLLVIGPFGYTYSWNYIPDTVLNKLAAFLIPFAGLAIVVMGISSKTVTKWIMVPVLIFCILISVIAGLVLVS